MIVVSLYYFHTRVTTLIVHARIAHPSSGQHRCGCSSGREGKEPNGAVHAADQQPIVHDLQACAVHMGKWALGP